MLPDFLVVGAARSGTTSLYRYLDQHPDIHMSREKEPHYFAFMEDKSRYEGPYDDRFNGLVVSNRKEYEDLFAGATEGQLIGECSTSYLHLDWCAERIKEAIPDAKIVALLRDPVDRAFSNYMHQVMIGHEPLTFQEAVNAAEGRKAANWRYSYQYIDQSRYSEGIAAYIDMFGRENVFVELFENFSANPSEVLTKVFEFLGLDPNATIRINVHNASGAPRNDVIHRFLTEDRWLKKAAGRLVPRRIRLFLIERIKDWNYRRQGVQSLDPTLAAALRKDFATEISNLTDLLPDIDFSVWPTFTDSDPDA